MAGMTGDGWAGGNQFPLYAPRSCYPVLKSPYVVCVCVFVHPARVALLHVSLLKSPFAAVPTGSPEFNCAVGPAVGDVLELELLESRVCQSRLRQIALWEAGNR